MKLNEITRGTPEYDQWNKSIMDTVRGLELDPNAVTAKPSQTLIWKKGDIIKQADVPQWAKHIVGDHPQQYHWLYPMDNGDLKIMQDVSIEKYGPEITIQVRRK